MMRSAPINQPESALIRTKLSRPPARASFVERPRLLERLDGLLEHRVTLVSAPPGFGKTTLAAQWLDRRRPPCAWLSVDPFDSDLEHFIRYLVAAVEGASTHRLPETAALLASRARPPSRHRVEVLASEMARLDSPLVLVLEDFHAAQSEGVQQLVERLIATMPDPLHLLVLTRRDPPWPLGSWRARGWLVELRAHDLRFSVAEARSFFMAGRPVSLSDPTVERLQERAEGWVAALRLMKLSLRDSTDPEERAREYSGREQAVADFLVDEVLAAQPPEVRELLAATAPLPRFCAALCDHVLGKPPSAPAAQELLARLERNNLFLVPLGTDGKWYRYHHLFRDMLLDHLPELSSPAHRRRVARRAGEWFGREGWVEEALQLWVDAGELDAAADLVGENLQAVIDQDLSRHVLRRWLEMFPAGAEHGRVPLLVAHGYLCITTWDLPRLGELLGEADGLLRDEEARSAKNNDGRFRADVAAQGAFLHYWLDDPRQALESASLALRLLGPRGGGLARQLAVLYQAGALRATGRRAEGVRLLERAAAEGQAAEKGRIGTYLMGAAFLHLYAADPDATRSYARRMLAVHETLPIPDFLLGNAYYLLGAAAYERNELEEAAAELGRVARMRYHTSSRLYQDALIGLALVAKARGEAEAVACYAADARAFALEVGDPVSLLVADSFEARLALRAEAGPTAMSAPTPRDVMFPWLEVPSLTYAEVLLRDSSDEARERALPFIEAALTRAEAHHTVRQAIPFSLLRAEALADRGRMAEALDVLAATVRRARPLGLVRTFLDRGPRVARLLEALAGRRGRGGYLGTLVSAAGAGEKPPRVPSRPGEVPASLEEPWGGLSRRETEVLALLAQRLSKKEIAERLGLSPDTVKTYTRTLYRKLGANRRRDAVARALTAELIPPRS